MRIILFMILASSLLCREAMAAQRYFREHLFEVYLLNDSRGGSQIAEEYWGSDTKVFVNEGEEYSIVVRNPLPVRVAAAVSVDGLNSLDGKRSTPSEGRKWMIPAYGTVTIRGWQVGQERLRKFVFERPERTYAKWREDNEGPNYTANLGIIGVAFFWNSRELSEALRPPPAPFAEGESGYYRDSAPSGMIPKKERFQRPSAGADELRGRRREPAEDRAGTGMGRDEQHRVQNVYFDYDTGMFSNADTIKIRYAFDRRGWQPSPFVEEGLRYQHGGFVREMP